MIEADMEKLSQLIAHNYGIMTPVVTAAVKSELEFPPFLREVPFCQIFNFKDAFDGSVFQKQYRMVVEYGLKPESYFSVLPSGDIVSDADLDMFLCDRMFEEEFEFTAIDQSSVGGSTWRGSRAASFRMPGSFRRMGTLDERALGLRAKSPTRRNQNIHRHSTNSLHQDSYSFQSNLPEFDAPNGALGSNKAIYLTEKDSDSNTGSPLKSKLVHAGSGMDWVSNAIKEEKSSELSTSTDKNNKSPYAAVNSIHDGKLEDIKNKIRTMSGLVKSETSIKDKGTNFKNFKGLYPTPIKEESQSSEVDKLISHDFGSKLETIQSLNDAAQINIGFPSGGLATINTPAENTTAKCRLSETFCPGSVEKVQSSVYTTDAMSLPRLSETLSDPSKNLEQQLQQLEENDLSHIPQCPLDPIIEPTIYKPVTEPKSLTGRIKMDGGFKNVLNTEYGTLGYYLANKSKNLLEDIDSYSLKKDGNASKSSKKSLVDSDKKKLQKNNGAERKEDRRIFDLNNLKDKSERLSELKLAIPHLYLKSGVSGSNSSNYTRLSSAEKMLRTSLQTKLSLQNKSLANSKTPVEPKEDDDEIAFEPKIAGSTTFRAVEPKAQEDQLFSSCQYPIINNSSIDLMQEIGHRTSHSGTKNIIDHKNTTISAKTLSSLQRLTQQLGILKGTVVEPVDNTKLASKTSTSSAVRRGQLNKPIKRSSQTTPSNISSLLSKTILPRHNTGFQLKMKGTITKTATKQ
jgi:hypothetical protein